MGRKLHIPFISAGRKLAFFRYDHYQILRFCKIFLNFVHVRVIPAQPISGQNREQKSFILPIEMLRVIVSTALRNEKDYALNRVQIKMVVSR